MPSKKFGDLALHVETVVRKDGAFGDVLEVHAMFVCPNSDPDARYNWDAVSKEGPLKNVKLRLMAFADYTYIPFYPTSWIAKDINEYTIHNVDDLSRGLKLVNNVYYRYIDKGGVKPHSVGEYLELMANLLGLSRDAYVRQIYGHTDENVRVSGLKRAVDNRIAGLMPQLTEFRI